MNNKDHQVGQLTSVMQHPDMPNLIPLCSVRYNASQNGFKEIYFVSASIILWRLEHILRSDTVWIWFEMSHYHQKYKNTRYSVLWMWCELVHYHLWSDAGLPMGKSWPVSLTFSQEARREFGKVGIEPSKNAKKNTIKNAKKHYKMQKENTNNI